MYSWFRTPLPYLRQCIALYARRGRSTVAERRLLFDTGWFVLLLEIVYIRITPGIRPNASGAATVSPDGKQVGKDFITKLIIIIKVCYLLYIL